MELPMGHICEYDDNFTGIKYFSCSVKQKWLIWLVRYHSLHMSVSGFNSKLINIFSFSKKLFEVQELINTYAVWYVPEIKYN